MCISVMVPRRRYTSYGKVKKPNVSYFHIFGSIFYILNYCEHLGKFDAKSDTIVFLGYATNSKAYRVYIVSLCEPKNVKETLLD